MSEIVHTTRLVSEEGLVGLDGQAAFEAFNHIVGEDPKEVARVLGYMNSGEYDGQPPYEEAVPILNVVHEVMRTSREGSQIGLDPEPKWDAVMAHPGHKEAHEAYREYAAEARAMRREIEAKQEENIAKITESLAASGTVEASLLAERDELAGLADIVMEYMEKEEKALLRTRGIYTLQAVALDVALTQALVREDELSVERDKQRVLVAA